jgi:hypothetical protein
VIGFVEVAEIGEAVKLLSLITLEVGCGDPVAWHWFARRFPAMIVSSPQDAVCRTLQGMLVKRAD